MWSLASRKALRVLLQCTRRVSVCLEDRYIYILAQNGTGINSHPPRKETSKKSFARELQKYDWYEKNKQSV